MTDRFTELLSDYLDQDLPRAEAETLERHLAGCEQCRDTLAELERVKSRAAMLVDPPAPTDLWAGIASRIGTAGSTSVGASRRLVVHELPRSGREHGPRLWGVPQWALAAAAFLVVAVGLSWIMQTRMTPALRPPDPVAHATTPASPGSVDASAATFDATAIETEIGQLQQALDRGRDKLDPKTVQVLEDNLRIIRKATEDARKALDADPANSDLRQYFAGSVQSKLNLVRRSVALASGV